MLIVISPAKTLDFEKARIVKQDSFPEFASKAYELVKELKHYNPEELMRLMGISEKLAALNNIRFKQWQKDPSKELARQAICAFKGEVYTGINVADWSNEDFSYAQEHLRILSGLYGVLRPLDYISPYRLEMGTKLPTKKSKNLYDYWGSGITKCVTTQLKKLDKPVLINLASNEYFKSIQTKKINAEIITPVFKDFKNGEFKVLSFFAKKARGMMSRFIIKNRLSQSEQLKDFSDDSYYFNDKLTKGNQWVFTRD
ncbi:MAG: peroxide stress protein YaaA [Salinivirgaceae bacterium]|jgi:cytoplasmic iron level regulating protein YaaA (DUF328/UPF0246 family)|nr:peroxide stress protein YaaA [Salinivirgaceae bacterium]